MGSDDAEGNVAGDDAEGDAAGDDADGNAAGAGSAREVVVPDPLYRVVTVFSTLFAVLLVVLGFLFFDVASGLIDRVVWLSWVAALLAPVPAYAAYRWVRADTSGREQAGVLLALYYAALFGVPGPLGAAVGLAPGLAPVPVVVPGVPVYVQAALGALGVSATGQSAAFALAGVACILLGASVYAFATRFRAEGMETDKGRERPESRNG